MIKKGAGRRPAPQNTGQEWDDKSFRPNHGRSNRCKEKLETSTRTEAHMSLKKEQDKNEVARASDQTTGEATDVKRSLRQVHRQRHTCY